MSKLKITFVGHATFLIEMDGESILTDPNFSNKILGMPRLQPPGIKPENLPPLNAITVTHGHYDHLDIFSYKYFSTQTPIVAPEGLGDFFRKFLPNPVTEISPWSEHKIGNIQVFTVPVKHQGFRLSGLTYRSTTGFIFKKDDCSIFFPGDTAYSDHFTEIAKAHKIDIALLPIGAYEPQWLMKKRHMNPEEALKAFEDLKARVMIPYHWGAFRFSAEKPEAPLEYLQKILGEKPDERVKILQAGQSYEE